jgi:formylglycine-generating enzyme required for sulfatase activity
VGSSIEHVFDYDVECVEHAEALALDEALVASMEKLVNEDLDSTAKHAGSFEVAEQTKEEADELAKIASGRITIPPNSFARDVAKPSVNLELTPLSGSQTSQADKRKAEKDGSPSTCFFSV